MWAMTDENKELYETKIDHTGETTGSVGQIILGEIEKIGGILTGDPITQAEGEYNIAAGTLREESNEALEETDEK